MKKIILLVTILLITLSSLQLVNATPQIRQPCIDSDSGRNYFVAGSVTYGSKVIVDACQNERYIREADCGTNYGIKYRDGCSHTGPGSCRYDCTKILNPYGTGTMCYNSRCTGYYLTINESIGVNGQQGVEYFTRAHLMRSEEDLRELHADSAVEIIGDFIEVTFGADTNAPMRNLRATVELFDLSLQPVGPTQATRFDLLGQPGLHAHQRVGFNVSYPEDFYDGFVKITLGPRNLQSVTLYVPVFISRPVGFEPLEGCESLELDVANFRCIFLARTEGDNTIVFNGKIVVASAGIDIDYQSAYHILQKLEEEGISTEGLLVNDTDPAAYAGAQNLLVIGSPCINTVTQNLRGNPENCVEHLHPGQAVIQTFKEAVAGEDLLSVFVIEGYTGSDALLAANVLMEIPSEDLEATEDAHGNLGICEGRTLEDTECFWFDSLDCNDIFEEDEGFLIGNEPFIYTSADVFDEANPRITFVKPFRDFGLIAEDVSFDAQGNAAFSIHLEGETYNFTNVSETSRDDWDIQHVSGTIDGRPFLC